MAQPRASRNVDLAARGPQRLVVRRQEPLFAIPDRDDPSVTHVFASEEEADAFVGPDSLQRALALAGAWSDLDWDEAERELYRIGHSTPPSPPYSE